MSKIVEFNYKFYNFCCRTPLGVRGLKSVFLHALPTEPLRRTPLGVRGLKYITFFLASCKDYCRTPFGVRGLK